MARKTLKQAHLPGMEAEQPQGSVVRESLTERGHSSAVSPPSDEHTASSQALQATSHSDLQENSGTCYIIDSHSLIFQVFHALPEMSSPQGEPVGAVYGFLRDMVYLLETHQPAALICAFDLPGPTFRHQLFDQYKADRGSMPEELASQLPKIRQVLAAMGIPVMEKPGFEADDLLATLARQCDEAGKRCLLVTGDKDCRQLITSQVSVYNIRKDELYDSQALQADWGIRPDQVIDFQALVGDKVDNVPGVPLIGPKIARELLTEYGSLEGVLNHAPEIKQAKRRQNLIEFREQALLSRKLVALDNQVEITPDWEAAKPGDMDHPRLAELLQQYGFRGLAERVAKLEQTPTVSPANVNTAQYTLVDTPEKLQQLVDELAIQSSQQTLLSIDTETTSLAPRAAEIVGYALAWQPGLTWDSDNPTGAAPNTQLNDLEPADIQSFYVPVRGPATNQVLNPELVLRALQPFLEDPCFAKIGQNLKYDQVVLRTAGIQLAGVQFDTMVASYLLAAGERSHNLDQLAHRYLGHTTIKIDSLIGKGKNQICMDQVEVAQVGPYAAEDAVIPLRLFPILQAGLLAQGLTQLNSTVEVPLIGILAEMEYQGVSVDQARLQILSKEFHAKLSQLTVEIEALAGHSLNIASPKQLAKLLFEELGLPVVKKTKTGPSTDASVLSELAEIHPLPAKIVLYRQFAKLLNTYVDALPALILPSTGRVHASLNQVVAATGRLSSSNPNLQNIPVRTAEGRDIRSAFRPYQPGDPQLDQRQADEAWKILAADYSQIELRVLAHVSGDQALADAFAEGADIHTLVASQVEGVPSEQVDGDMRRRAKGVNFGIIYGQSPFGLAKSLGISQEEATTFIETYFARYPGVQAFLATTINQCREQGYVSTLLGRRRSIQGVRPVPDDFRDPKTGGLRQLNLPERTAVNTVIQGTAADLIKLAMIAVDRRLRQDNYPATLILQIHDELLLEVAPAAIDPLAEMVRHEMTQVRELDVPLCVDVKAGDNWAECVPWEG